LVLVVDDSTIVCEVDFSVNLEKTRKI
jgi:hypothetical protein